MSSNFVKELIENIVSGVYDTFYDIDNSGTLSINDIVVSITQGVPPKPTGTRKILCLHGGGGNSSFAGSMEDIYKNALENNSNYIYEFYGINGPYNNETEQGFIIPNSYLWVEDVKDQDPPTTSWASYANPLIRTVNEWIQTENNGEPPYALLGYSQGSSAAFIYLGYGGQEINDNGLEENQPSEISTPSLPPKCFLFNGYLETGVHLGIVEYNNNLQSQYTITFESSVGIQHYNVEGNDRTGPIPLLEDPDIVIRIGDTISFVQQLAGHPLRIRNSQNVDITEDIYTQPGETFDYTFEIDGEYTYYCVFHPNMSGKITVQDTASFFSVPSFIYTSPSDSTIPYNLTQEQITYFQPNVSYDQVNLTPITINVVPPSVYVNDTNGPNHYPPSEQSNPEGFRLFLEFMNASINN